MFSNIFFKKVPYLRKLGIKILKEAKEVVFLSEPYRNILLEKYLPNKLKEDIHNKSHIIPNGIDEFWFNNMEKEKSESFDSKINLLQVGVLNKNKNVTSTIQAIRLLQSRGYNIKFTVVGEIENNKIYKNIRELDFIKYVPPKTKEELIQIYRENAIFVMPSITETFGLVYAEAMSQGLPVIYTKEQGFDKQFEEGVVGYSVDCFNPEEISQNILGIIEKYNDISKNCIDLVKKFSWDRIIEEYFNIYFTK